MNAMYKEARALGVIPTKDPLDGWGIDAKIVLVVNHVSKTLGKIILRARSWRDEK